MRQKNKRLSIIVLYGFIFLLLAAAFFTLVFIPRESAFLKTLGVLARYNLTRFLPALSILLLASCLIKNSGISQLYIWAAVLLVHALALVGLWGSAYSENYVIAGLAPRSDAFFNYAGALNFWLRGRLSGFASRRPLFGTFLAFLLWVSGGNLQIALAALAFLSALAACAAFSEMRAGVHPLGAVLFFLVQFLFARRFIGLTMSEILGWMLGSLSLAIWLYALAAHKTDERVSLRWFLLGAFVYMLAQMTRPAAVFTLPLLLLFAGWLWRGGRKFSLAAAGWTLAVLALGYLANSQIYALFGSGDTTLNNNLGYGIYGLAVGGQGWRQIFFDYPELNNMSADIRGQRIMQIVASQILRHPGDYLRGLWVQARVVFSFSETNSLFSFASGTNTAVNYALMGALMLLLAAGAVTAVRRWKQPAYLLLVFLLAGTFLSMTVSPAFQTQYMRVFAASIPALAYGVGAGMDGIMSVLGARFAFLARLDAHAEKAAGSFWPLMGGSLAGMLLLAPFVLGWAGQSTALEPQGCPDGQAEAAYLMLPGTAVTIFENTPARMTWAPFVSKFDYQRDIHSICCDDDIAYYKAIPAGTTLFPTINLLEGSDILVVAPVEEFPSPGALVRACGRIEDIYHEPSNRGFFYPEQVEILQP